MNKFEQLIEYVINDEEQKARDLFHDIVVEKSRGIYEELMAEDVTEEVMDEDSHEQDDKHDNMEEGMGPELGGDQADDLIDDIESEEQGLAMEDDDDMEDMDDMGENEAELEDRVVDLEDKLDELMAEFEALMNGDQDGEEKMDMDMDVEVDDEADDMGMQDMGAMNKEFDTEGMSRPMEEAISLKTVSAAAKSEDGSINKKSTVAANSGARGMDAKPVMSHGSEEKGRPAPTAKDIMTGEVQNAPAKSTVRQNPAAKPHLAQATGVNTKSPY